MLKFTIVAFQKSPGFMVKGVCKIDGGDNDDKADRKQELQELQDKLQQIIPASMHAKYVLSSEDLAIKIKAADASRSLSCTQKMKEYITDAATSLHLQIRM